MLQLKFKPKKETLYQVNQDINLIDKKRREGKSSKDILVIFVLFILISLVNWQSNSNYSTVNRVNWLLEQSDNPK